MKSKDELPHAMDLNLLKDGKDLPESLLVNKAKHHKKCKEQFSEKTLSRIEKKIAKVDMQEDTPPSNRRLMRSSSKLANFLYK